MAAAWATRANRPRLAFLALLVGATGIGFAPILVRLSETGPTATALFRLLFALPLIWVWLLLERREDTSPQPRTARQFGALALSGLLFTGDLSIWHWSLQFTTVANSTLITNIAPLLVTIAAWLFLGERMTSQFVIGLLLALAGAAVLLGNSYTLSSRHLLGDVVSVISAMFYAAYLISVKQLRTLFSTPVIMAWVGLSSAVGFALVAWLSGDVMWPATSRGWLVLVTLAVVCHLGGQTLIAYGFGHLPASISSVTLLWQPVVAAVVAWVFLGERMGWQQGIGAGVVLAGMILAARK